MNYYQGKGQARGLAIIHQKDQTPKTWEQIAQEKSKLEKLAKRYGLIKEFRENGII